MALEYRAELTDTFDGDANYSWVRRATVTVPELTHYGYDGSSGYAKANKIARRELMRKAKAAVGYTGVQGRTSVHGDVIEFRPYNIAAVLFVEFVQHHPN